MRSWLPPRVWSLIPLAIGLNVIGGQLAQVFRLPIYLDSLGTMLVGILGGPLAGALTGGISILIIAAAGNLIFVPFASVGMVIGGLSGVAAHPRVLKSWAWSLLAGCAIGIAAAACSAPISAYLFGGVTGSTNDLIVAGFRVLGLEKLGAVFAQALLVDPLDKTLSFVLVVQLLKRISISTLVLFRPGLESIREDEEGEDPGQAVFYPQASEISDVMPSLPPSPPSSLFVAGEGVLYRMAPMIKLGLVGLILVGNIVNTTWILGLQLVVMLGLLFESRLLASFVRLAFYCWFPFLLSLMVIQALFESPDSAIAVCGQIWEYSWLGCLLGVVKALRFLVFFAGIYTLLRTTRHRHMGHLFLSLGMPKELSFIILSSLSSIAGVMRYMETIATAQTVRGLPPAKGLGARIYRFFSYVLPLTQRLLQDVAQRSVSLYGRGFQSQYRAFPYRPFVEPGQWLFALGLGCLGIVQYWDYMAGGLGI